MRETEGKRRLIGDGVELRRHEKSNYALYAEWYGDEEVWRLTSWAAQPMRRAEVEKLFEGRAASRPDGSFAIHREGEDEPLGVISLMNVSEVNLSADLSIIVGSPKDRDEGLGSEAIKVLLDYAFEESGLNRVGLSVFEFNEQAIKAYQKIGFKEEGRLRGALRRDGQFYDAILMSVLASEWREWR